MTMEAPGDCRHLNCKWKPGGHLGSLHCYMLMRWLGSNKGSWEISGGCGLVPHWVRSLCGMLAVPRP